MEIVSIEELEGDNPPMCNTDNCQSSALFIYEGNTSKEVWKSCIDCQLKDYQKWPTIEECNDATNDIPFSKEMEDVIRRKYSIDTNISLPSYIVRELSNKAAAVEINIEDNNESNNINNEQSTSDEAAAVDTNTQINNSASRILNYFVGKKQALIIVL